MKMNCSYADCNQSIEYGPEYAGKVLPCPSCGKPLVFPKPAFWENAWTSIKAFFCIYFDTKSVSPDASSPYLAVIRVALYCYRLFAGMLLIVVPLSAYELSKQPWHNGKWTCFVLAAFLSWLILYFPYKLFRVAFDIAEYLRQINKTSA